MINKTSGFNTKSNGIVYIKKGDFQTTIIEKQGDEVRLKLLCPESTEWQSRIDLNNPNRLMCPYMGIMMLALLWQKEPARVHILGLGGGNFPLLLRHHLPDLAIDCTEIDRDVYDLAIRFFGFHEDARMKVFIKDGRDFLASRSTQDLYDVIFVDAFRGVGFSPLRLATKEFLHICKSQLQPGGMVVLNLLPTDGITAERLFTIQSSFRSTYVYNADELVIFASDSDRIFEDELMVRALALQERHAFGFPYVCLLEHLAYASANGMILPGANQKAILTDAISPKVLQIPENLLRCISRNDSCPCGSGRKFKKCHGSP